MSFRSVAVDLEFVKCRGHPFMRSIAFVPFTRAAAVATPTNTLEAAPAAAAFTAATQQALPPYRTCFHSPSTVLALTTDAVMRQAEVLPCGHVLLSYMRDTNLAEPALAAIKDKYAQEADTQLSAYRALRRDLRAAQKSANKRQSTKKEEDPEDGYEDGDAEEMEEAGTKIDLSLSPAEAALRREMQMRCGIAKHFERLDPYSLPNLRVLQDKEALRTLYTAPPDSNELKRASVSLSSLRRYGKGKGPQKSLSFLFRYYPSFIQEVLRATFSGPGEWLAWLEEATRLTEEELRTTAAHHRQLAADGGCTYTELETLEALGTSTRQTWAAYQQRRQQRVKFYCYGNVDNSVLYRTVLLSEQQQQQQQQSSQSRFSSRGTAAGRGGRQIPQQSGAAVVLAHEAKLVDVTHHPVFLGSGFKQGKHTPSLSVALEKTARRDETAVELLRSPRAHDPLWDAQALACVGAAAGLC